MIPVLAWQQMPLAELLARRERMPHALLIHGRKGIGKVVFARALAQSLLCETPGADGIACGICPACGWFTEANHPDFREIVPEAMSALDDEDDGPAAEPAKPEKKSAWITIDQVRDIGQFMTLSTHRDGFRVLLVHPADAMNAAAANALLKTLEEPARRSLILLVSDQPGRLLATVRSRCQKFALAVPDSAAAIAWLVGQGVDGATAPALLAQAGGAPLLALQWAEPDYRAQRRRFLEALSAPNDADWLGLAAAFEKSDLRQVMHWLQTWCADLILQKSAGRIGYNPDCRGALEALARRAPLPALFRYESQLRSSRRTLAHPLNARLLLEQLFLSYNRTVEPTDR